MPDIDPKNDSDDVVFEEVRQSGILLKRIGRLKTTGITVLESTFDECQREVQKCFFDNEGHLSKRAIYEYDEERKPQLTTVFDKHGNLVMRQERGKRPEVFG